MMTPMKYHPVAPVSDNSFGFEEIMRNPDYTRFMNWYAQFSYFARGRQTAIAVGARAAEAAAAARPPRSTRPPDTTGGPSRAAGPPALEAERIQPSAASRAAPPYRPRAAVAPEWSHACGRPMC